MTGPKDHMDRSAEKRQQIRLIAVLFCTFLMSLAPYFTLPCFVGTGTSKIDLVENQNTNNPCEEEIRHFGQIDDLMPINKGLLNRFFKVKSTRLFTYSAAESSWYLDVITPPPESLPA